MAFIIGLILGFVSMHLWTHYTTTGKRVEKWYFDQFDKIEMAIRRQIAKKKG